MKNWTIFDSSIHSFQKRILNVHKAEFELNYFRQLMCTFLIMFFSELSWLQNWLIFDSILCVFLLVVKNRFWQLKTPFDSILHRGRDPFSTVLSLKVGPIKSVFDSQYIAFENELQSLKNIVICDSNISIVLHSLSTASWLFLCWFLANIFNLFCYKLKLLQSIFDKVLSKF